MAIAPPGDIVAEVAKAFDPVKFAAARKRLVAAGMGIDLRFQSAMKSAAMQLPSATSNNVPNSSPLFDRYSGAARVSGKGDLAQAAQKLEALLIKQALEIMLPKNLNGLSNSSSAGRMWRSILADTLAAEIGKNSSLGLANRIFSNIHSEKNVVQSLQILPAGNRNSTG